MMAAAVIIRHTPHGRRAFPISLDEADKLVDDGAAVRHTRTLIEESAPTPLYETKVMIPTSEPQTAPTTKTGRRGRKKLSNLTL